MAIRRFLGKRQIRAESQSVERLRNVKSIHIRRSKGVIAPSVFEIDLYVEGGQLTTWTGLHTISFDRVCLDGGELFPDQETYLDLKSPVCAEHEAGKVMLYGC